MCLIDSLTVFSTSGVFSISCPKELVNLEPNSGLTLSQKHRLAKKKLEWQKESNCKAIVVYGQNLPSGLGQKRVLEKHVKYMYGIPTDKLGMLFGLLLSDAWLILDKNYRSINARLGLKQSMINFSFLFSKSYYTV